MIEQRLRLDIRIFRRRGWLTAGQAGTLRWAQPGQETASLRYLTRNDALILEYEARDDAG